MVYPLAGDRTVMSSWPWVKYRVYTVLVHKRICLLVITDWSTDEMKTDINDVFEFGVIGEVFAAPDISDLISADDFKSFL